MSRSLKVICLLVIALAALAASAPSQAQVAVGVSIRIGPPALPVYAQPICPGPGYIWTPGYWAYGPDGYYWVPGTWVVAPAPGLLWTPGYWGWSGGLYAWHAGYWGPHVGFYGGINYGFGYGGVGFVGGEWRGGVFHYNTAVTNVNTTIIHNTYVNNTVVNNTTIVNHTSFNGGPHGISARPTAAEVAAGREHHTPATSLQTHHEHAAGQNRAMLAAENHGRPSVAATSKPGAFSGRGVVAAHGESARTHFDRPPNSSSSMNHAAVHSDHPPTPGGNKPATSYSAKPNSGVPKNSSHPHNNPYSNDSHPSNSHPNNSHPNSHASPPPAANAHGEKPTH